MKSNLTTLCLLGLTVGCGTGITPEKQSENEFNSNDEYQDSGYESQEDTSALDQEDTGITDTGESDTSQGLVTDFSEWGPHYPYGITSETRTASVTNCSNLSYEVYTPYVDNPPTVVLGHGFARGSGVMTGWAEHLSSWGVEVLLPTLCHYNVWAGVDHEMNGQNMKELSDLHGATDVVYAGHSAGGLAAIIAASQDPDAIGVLGLDATDTQDVPGVPDLIGMGYAGNVSCPAFSIIGEPSTCNADNNGLNLFKEIDGYRALKVISSDHCDFESPTDWVCESQCMNDSVEFSDEEIRPVILTLGTAAIMSLTGLSEDGAFVWSNEGLESWLSTGLIQEK